MHNTGIYEIRNTVNGKRYVGSAVDFGTRWAKHLSLLKRNVHHSRQLQRSWNRDGELSFEFRKLIICDKSMLLTYEQAAMDAFRPEYNVLPKAGSCLGHKRSPESIAKTVATRTARGGWSPSAETRAKISATLKGQPGRPHSQESIERMRVAQRTRDLECLRPVWDRKKGVPRTPEVRAKLSQANARLSAAQVAEIRERYTAGEMQKNLAPEFGLTNSCVSEIVRRVTYKWVE